METFRAALWRRQILQRNAPLPIIRSDNGPQFVSHLFESECERWNVEHERIPPKTPNMNAHIESYHRLHSSLHYLSPAEFYRRHLETGLQPKRPVKVLTYAST